MTSAALGQVHLAARTIWDAAIENAGSIENMRDLIMPLRNQHFEVINGMRMKEQDEATKLGLQIALALVLAVQSEDAKLETYAVECFKQFLWQPGEEPFEFVQGET